MTISKQQMAAALERMPQDLVAKTLNMQFQPHFLGKNKFAYRLERFDSKGVKTADWMLYDAKEGGQTMLVEGRKLEKSLETAKAPESFQFMRLGYFCPDSKDSKPGHLVFNRSVGLKDSFKPAK